MSDDKDYKLERKRIKLKRSEICWKYLVLIVLTLSIAIVLCLICCNEKIKADRCEKGSAVSSCSEKSKVVEIEPQIFIIQQENSVSKAVIKRTPVIASKRQKKSSSSNSCKQIDFSSSCQCANLSSSSQ
jgi:hypothetical protein